MTYWENINEKLVELYTRAKHNLITLEEFKEARLNISKGL